MRGPGLAERCELRDGQARLRELLAVLDARVARAQADLKDRGYVGA